MLKRLRVFAKEKRNVKLNQSLFPFIPAKAGIQRFWLWVPAFAGTNRNVNSTQLNRALGRQPRLHYSVRPDRQIFFRDNS